MDPCYRDLRKAGMTPPYKTQKPHRFERQGFCVLVYRLKGHFCSSRVLKPAPQAVAFIRLPFSHAVGFSGRLERVVQV